MTTPRFHRCLPLASLADESAHALTIAGHEIVLCHHQGALYAIDNRCSHADQALACGMMRYGWIACPAHGARFDLASGEALAPPATEPIRTYPVRVTDGQIEIEL